MTFLRPVVQRSRNSTQPPVSPIKLIFYFKKKWTYYVATSKSAIFGNQRHCHLAAQTAQTQKFTEQIQFFSFKLIQFHSPTHGACIKCRLMCTTSLNVWISCSGADSGRWLMAGLMSRDRRPLSISLSEWPLDGARLAPFWTAFEIYGAASPSGRMEINDCS